MEKLSIDNAFKQSNKRSRKKLVNFAQPKDVKEFLKNKKEPENNPEIEKL
ncbi:hypothetical protein KAS41_01310 [Candidatus Parcubacteria bacterium]|nr:hypothetical protein [Candidatus Parcubacteria bacterium]